MAVNNKYATLGQGSSSPSIEKFDSFSFKDIGDEIQGIVLDFTDPYEMPNKFYEPDGQDKDKPWKATTTQVKVNLKTKDGNRSLYLQKKGHFSSLAEALVAADMSDLKVGCAFRMKWTGLGEAPKGGGSRPHKFEAEVRDLG